MPELDADKLVENIEKYGSADGGPAEPQKEAAPPPAEAQAAPASTGFSFKSPDELLKHKLKYTASGKDIEEDIGTILKRASQGYNYAQAMNQLNTERSQWETKCKTADEINQKWSRFEEYAQKDPAWYQHWENAWNNRGQNLAEPQTSDGNLEQKLQLLLEEKLKPVNELLSQHEQKKVQEKLSAEDQELDRQVKSIREKYSDLDFDATDPESGKSLEYKVIEFGLQNGIKNFEHAFNAFYRDELEKRAAEKAKDALSKEKQAKAKAGIIDSQSTSAPKTPPPNYKSLNWDQLRDLASKELGIS